MRWCSKSSARKPFTRTADVVARAIRTSEELPVLLVGEVFAWVPNIRDRVIAAVRKTDKVSILESAEGVHGAARLALELALGNDAAKD
jgi:hypothetical protein